MVGFHPADPDSNSGTSTFRPPCTGPSMADYCDNIVCHCGFRNCGGIKFKVFTVKNIRNNELDAILNNLLKIIY